MGTQVELVQVGGGKRVSAAVDDDDSAATSATASVEKQIEFLSLVAASQSPPLPFSTSKDPSATALLLLKSHRDATAASCHPPPATATDDLQEMIDG
jgi:hypothetical protein